MLNCGVSNKKSNELDILLLQLLIFFLPYDAIRFLPTLYRPLSLIPLILLVIILIPKFFQVAIDKASACFIIFYILILFSSTAFVVFGMLNVELYFGDLITFTIGFLLFLSSNITFRKIRLIKSKEEFKIWFAQSVAIAYYFPLFIAVLDCLSYFNILPIKLSEIIHLIFGGWQSRVSGVTSEASWLVIHLLFSGGFYLYLYFKIKKKIHLFCAVLSLIIVILSASLNGYIILIASSIICWVYFCRRRNRLIFWISPFIAAVAIIILFIVLSTIDSDVYFIKRFQSVSFDELYHNDISVFVRLTNPLVSVIMGLTQTPIGVGLGGYSQYYGYYIHNLFPWVLNVYNGKNEVVETIATNSATPKSLFGNIISCGGWLSIIYFAGVFICYRNIRQNHDLIIPAVIVLFCTLQFDSLCFFIWIVVLSFFNNLELNKLKR